MTGRIASKLTTNSQCTHWVSDPSPPVTGGEEGAGDDDIGRLCHNTILDLASYLRVRHDCFLIKGDILPNLGGDTMSSLARLGRLAGFALARCDHQ